MSNGRVHGGCVGLCAARGRGRLAGAVFLTADHYRVVPAGVQSAWPGRQAVRTAGLYQDLRDGGERGAGRDFDAGADGLSGSWPDPRRTRQSAQPRTSGAVPTGTAGLVAASTQRSTAGGADAGERSEEHTSELQSLMRISYAVFCLNTKQHTS